MSFRRRADPVYLQYIWNAIETASASNFQSILSAIQANFDPKFTAARLTHELGNAISDGCVRNVQGQYVLVDGFEHIKKDGRDWYCYECHAAGLVVACPTCFRVYHSDCIASACEAHWSCRLPVEDPTVGSKEDPDMMEVPPTHPCPVCKRLKRVSPSADNTTTTDLQKIFSTAFDCIRNRVNWKTMQKVGYLYEPLRNEYLVYRQINTRMIGERLRADPSSPNGYPNRTTFLVDLDNLVHNAAVFYGNKHVISNMARQIRSHLRRAMRESVYCVDCYTRPSSLSPIARLTSPCRKPHRLLWFQHNGWSFRPCKMLYESAEGYEVVCFGGRHEREFVPRVRAFDMTFTAPDLGLRMTPSLKKALDEAEEYKANQSSYDRNLPITISGVHTTESNQISSHSRQKHSSQRSLSKGHKSISSSEKVLASNRKRKSTHKSNSSIIWTDSESAVSVSSACAKRRKANNPLCTNFVSDIPVKNASSTHSSSKALQDYTDDNSLSSELDSDCETTGTSLWKAEKTQLLHSHSNLPNTTTKPIIRIKPIPHPDEIRIATEPSRSLNSSTGQTETIRVKTKVSTSCSSSSSHSVHSAPSSGSATVPAVASREDGISGESSLSSLSTTSSNKASRHLSSRHHSTYRKHNNKLTVTVMSKSASSKVSRRSSPVTQKIDTDSSALRNFDQRISRLSRSASSSSSADDSDTSSSSCTMSPSSTSSLLSSSSSTLSTSSSILSSMRRPSKNTPLPPADKISEDTARVSHKADVNATYCEGKKISDTSGRKSHPEQKSSSQNRGTISSNHAPTSAHYDNCNGNVGKTNKYKKLPTTQTAPKIPESTQSSHESLALKTNSTVKTAGSTLPSTRFPNSCGSHTPVTVISASGLASTGPTPPFASSSSSSWHSSVSPAAMSTTSGLGSSLSDPKSVDASPGEGVLLSGSVSGGHHSNITQNVTTDSNALKSVEEHFHRIYADRLALLTAERDQIREEMARRDALINKMRVEHEAEIKRVKQLTWCQVCLNEAFYHCCPGTAYCSESCQLQHWTQQHNRDCRRRGEVVQ